MQHLFITDEISDQIALYALGALDAQEAEDFEAHLEEGCGICAQELAAFQGPVLYLAASAPPVRPPSLLRERILDRIQVQEVLQRGDDLPWKPEPLPGLSMKRFQKDPQDKRFFALARMEGNVLYPQHWHQDIEEMYVLGGRVHIAGQVLEAGDFYSAPAGSLHEIRSGSEGCICLILSPDVDEPVEQFQSQESPRALQIVRATDSEWSSCGVDGVQMRILSADSGRGTVTALVRMEAGSRLPSHHHATAEQFYLLEGSASVEEHLLQAGDYYRIAADTRHHKTSSSDGCLLLLVASALSAAA